VAWYRLVIRHQDSFLRQVGFVMDIVALGEVSDHACLLSSLIISLMLCIPHFSLWFVHDVLAGCDSHTVEQLHLLGCYTMLTAEE
jgi:hypothetical protein